MLGGLFTDREGPPRAVPGSSPGSPERPAEAWYLSRSAPPAMVTAADAPIFPDPVDEAPGEPVRAYEEALPREIYEPPPAKPSTPLPAAADARVAPVPPAPTNPSVSQPWRRFAVVARRIAGRPRIAIVIDDMGVDKKRSARVISMKGPLTLSFLTYATELRHQTAAARAAGHELLLHVPMEPRGRNVDPGPNVLSGDVEAGELGRRLDWGLSRFDAYVGINNHMGSRFTADRAAMTVFMKVVKRRGLLFLDSRTTGATVGGALARRFGVPFAERNIFLDNENEAAAVVARLREVEALARRKGYAIAIGHPRDATLKALVPWLAGIESRGFVLVPVTAVVNPPRASG